MFLYVLNILFILVQTFEIQASEEYYEPVSNVSWDEAINLKDCDIALPKVKVNPNRYTTEIDYDIGNREVWVGYYTMMTVFEYIGCVPINSTRSTYILPRQANGPGVCYTLCRPSRKDTVGISRGKCFCLDKAPENGYKKSDCSERCGKPVGLVCGGKSHMSVYRSNMNATNRLAKPSLSEQNCLKIERYESQGSLSTTKSWEQCRKDFKGICLNGDYRNFKIPQDGNGRVSFPWINYTELHMEQCISPLTYADILLIEAQYSGPSWTGVVRSEVGYNHTELAESRQHIKYGYLMKRNSETVLNFENSDIVDRAVLCRKSSAGKTSTDRQGSDVVTPVVVSVVVILVIIAVVTAFVILRRRETIPVICKRPAHKNESGKSFPDTNLSDKTIKKTYNNQSYDYHSDSAHHDALDLNGTSTVRDNDYAHTYFELEEHERQSDNESTTYNKAGSAKQDSDTKGDNVYNKLKSDVNATYDHACIKTEHRVNKSERTYDTTAKAALRLKAQASQSSDAFGDTDENDYSHINDTHLEKNKTDNVYGLSNQLGNGSGANGESHNSEGDTYSHINDNPPYRSKPDNLYGAVNQLNVPNKSEKLNVTEETTI